MTAIFGFSNHPGADVDRLEAMARSMSHRGAAAPEYFCSESAAIGFCATHRRHGKSNPDGYGFDDGNVQVILDGKIVNGRSILESLSPHSDDESDPGPAEIIARLYLSRGDSCIESLRGSFAIAIYDRRGKRLLLARDHLGHKPVFFAHGADGFHFASETRALVDAGAVRFDVDLQSLSHFLSLRFVPAPHSLIRGVRKLPPAHIAVHENGKTHLRRYWQPSYSEKMDLGLDDVIDALDEKMHETISAYLPGTGVPGAFLSGGLDSGLIVASMAESLGKPFDTFSLGVENDSDEVPIARHVAARYDAIQHEAYPRDDMVRLLPEMIWGLGEPSDMVLVSKFLLARMAAPKVDTVLSGDGGDELFAGFMRYLGLRDAEYYRYVPAWLRERLISPIARLLGGEKGLNNMAGKVLWLTKVTGAGDLPQRYAEAVEYLRFRHADKQALFTRQIRKEVDGVYSGLILSELVRQSDAEDPVEKLLHTDFLTRLPEHLLMLDDRTGAAQGVDVLCPLADKELVEFSTQIPVDMKIRGRSGKFIERKVAERRLPPEAVKLRKTGWSFPFSDLCAGPLYPFLRSVFSDAKLVRDDILDGAEIERLITEHSSMRADHHIRIWMLLSLEIWYRMASENLHYEDMKPWMDRHLSKSDA